MARRGEKDQGLGIKTIKELRRAIRIRSMIRVNQIRDGDQSKSIAVNISDNYISHH
jgi:hypothetical protein